MEKIVKANPEWVNEYNRKVSGKHSIPYKPDKPIMIDKELNTKVAAAVMSLAYRCLQWEDGEIKGFDMQMMESLLPIILKPLTDATIHPKETPPAQQQESKP